MARKLLSIGTLLLWLAAVPAAWGQSLPSTEEMAAERVLGKDDAPVTIIEYASMTCPHCAAFHADRLPAIKEEYIETGKAKLIYRDFPLDQLSLVAAMVARCAPPERYFGLVDILFKSQASWSRAQDPVAELVKIGRLAGLTEAKVDACLEDRELYTAILERRQRGEREHKVDGTPYILVDGARIDGNAPMERFREVIDAAAK